MSGNRRMRRLRCLCFVPGAGDFILEFQKFVVEHGRGGWHRAVIFELHDVVVVFDIKYLYNFWYVVCWISHRLLKSGVTLQEKSNQCLVN